MHRHVWIACHFLCAAIALAALGALARAQTPAQSPPSNSTSADPIDLFEKIYPVFAHPRCVNCHGVVESVPGEIRSLTGTNHFVPVDVRDTTCGECHNQPEVLRTAWQFTAPPSMSFVGKDLYQMCDLQSDEVRAFDRAVGSHSGTVSGSYMHHLINDPLIEAGFAGRAGGNIDPPQIPPMSKGGFIGAAQKWIDAGAGCGRLTGTITQVETFASNYTYPYVISGTVIVTETATRNLTINRYSDGNAVATVTMSGHGKITISYVSDGCATTIISINDWVGTNSNPVDIGRLEIAQNGDDYDITFSMPEVKTQQTTSGSAVSSCTHSYSTGPETEEELTWDPWPFTIHCPPTFTEDPENTIECNIDPSQPRPVLSGRMMRMVVGASDSVERQSWLNVSPVGTSRADNAAPIAVKVETTWNLTANP